MKQIYIAVLSIAATGFLHSCVPTQQIKEIKPVVLPATYNNSTDSSNSALLSPQELFTDPHLKQLIDTAIANNYDLQMALQRIRIAQSDVLLGNGALKPRVDASVVSALRRYGLYTMDGAGNASTFMLPGKIVPTNLPDYFPSFQSSWEIDLWGKLKNRKKAAVSRYLASTEGKNFIVTNLVSDLAIAYYELQAIDETIRIIDETIALQQQAFEIIQAKKEAAVLNELAVKQFEAQLINLQAFRISLQQQVIETESRINLLTGRLPQKIIRSKTFAATSLANTIKAGVPAALLEQRPDIRQAALLVRATKADVAAAKAAYYPSLNITAGIGYQAFRPDLLFQTPQSLAYSLVGNLAAPLVNRAGIKAAFNTATAAQQESLYQYSKTIVHAYTEVYNGLIRADNLKEVYRLKTDETTTLSESILVAQELFRTGRATYLEVLYAQQNTLKAKLELVETRKQQLFTSIQLYKSLGGGWR
ncbi:NodT family efflux transporter outer membrane factor (OMF) lipoprotein [Lacibacter cauensis]|uniref:NodT family efflux transporter outer membrane factor (OMF) lipoprotein n=1 Tax=Lacibacter cauensis TaxID=510947 RepID=A0A562SLN5_9BACT|nr:efflux transporter outer membrane subunit [Lacibacter cauensis]TWI81600.1 NodT family efflux transporter outer membrane factor (OMF) lipoprotein [Lacibacter cauensis]